MEHRPIVIAGAGPSSAATALAMHRLDPHLDREIVVLEKARHPRAKVCAGGLIPVDLPHVVVDWDRRSLAEAAWSICQPGFTQGGPVGDRD